MKELKDCLESAETFIKANKMIAELHSINPNVASVVQKQLENAMDRFVREHGEGNGAEVALGGVLDNARVKELFIKAGNAGLIEDNTWQGTKENLAYFVEKICKECAIYYNKNIYWKPFETYFKVSNLGGAKRDYLKVYTNFTPNGCDKIDKLFTP